MKKIMFAMLAAVLMLTSCGYERVDAGYEGIKVNLYGDSKGVEHPRQKLNFYWDFEKIEDSSKRLYCEQEMNWRQVEIQAAIGAMQVILTSRINYDKPRK